MTSRSRPAQLRKTRLSERKRTGSQPKGAHLLHRQGQLAGAASRYRHVLATNPRDADVLHQLGVIQAKMRNFPAAIQLIDQAIEFGSDNAALISDRGIVLQNLNRWDDALADY